MPDCYWRKVGPQGQEGGLDGGQYDSVDNHIPHTLVGDFGGRGMGWGRGWAEFLSWVLGSGNRLFVGWGPTRRGHRSIRYQWVFKVWREAFEFIAFSIV